MKKKIILSTLVLSLFSCGKKEKLNEQDLTQKIKVLNVGTFHMGYTSDKVKKEGADSRTEYLVGRL